MTLLVAALRLLALRRGNTQEAMPRHVDEVLVLAALVGTVLLPAPHPSATWLIAGATATLATIVAHRTVRHAPPPGEDER